MLLGKALVRVREEKGLSQNRLAKEANLNRGYLYRLETDQISPTLNTLEEICRTLGISVSELVGYAERPEDT